MDKSLFLNKKPDNNVIPINGVKLYGCGIILPRKIIANIVSIMMNFFFNFFFSFLLKFITLIIKSILDIQNQNL